MSELNIWIIYVSGEIDISFFGYFHRHANRTARGRSVGHPLAVAPAEFAPEAAATARR